MILRRVVREFDEQLRAALEKSPPTGRAHVYDPWFSAHITQEEIDEMRRFMNAHSPGLDEKESSKPPGR